MTSNQKTVEELFAASAHLGHKKNRIHPKSRKYIYRMENGVSIIDLTITADSLENIKTYVQKIASEGKKLLLVCTKKIAANKMMELSKKNNIFYVTNKWPAGLLTNFETIMKNIKKLNRMKKDKADGVWLKFVKHEQSRMERDLNKLERNYGGLASLERLPDVLFIIDVKKEKNAVSEARKSMIPIIAIADTNINPELIDFPIPANDDSLSSIEYIANEIISAYTKARKN